MSFGSPYLDLEVGFGMKNLFNSIGCNNVFFDLKTQIAVDFRSDYLLNCNIVGIEQADFILLLNSNLRIENPILNSRLRKAYLHNLKSNKPLLIFSIGCGLNYLTYPVKNLGSSTKSIKEIVN